MPAQMQAFWNALMAAADHPRAIAQVFEDSTGQAAGYLFASFWEEPALSLACLEVEDIYVDEPFRRRGAARHMLLFWEDAARAAGTNLLRSGTDRQNAASKQALPLPQMFALLAENMRKIAPTGNTPAEDWVLWRAAMQAEWQRPEKRWILAFSGNTLAGYALYCIDDAECRMDEMQVAQAFQGDGTTFPALLGKLLRDAAHTQTLRAYVNKRNPKPQGILRAMGLLPTGETPRGWQFAGATATALSWYHTRFVAAATPQPVILREGAADFFFE
jgi:GNAT superfamily N-acetyltransferase